MNQLELEAEMVSGGRDRAMNHINNNEDGGHGYNNPYAQAVYRRFVSPLGDLIQAYLAEVKRGVQASAKGMLRDFDPMVLSFITVRTLLGTVGTDDPRLANASASLGRLVYGEHLLSAFEGINPQLYYTLVNDFERRMTASERHRH